MQNQFINDKVVTIVDRAHRISVTGRFKSGDGGVYTIILSDGTLYRNEGNLYVGVVDNNGQPAKLFNHRLNLFAQQVFVTATGALTGLLRWVPTLRVFLVDL